MPSGYLTNTHWVSWGKKLKNNSGFFKNLMLMEIGNYIFIKLGKAFSRYTFFIKTQLQVIMLKKCWILIFKNRDLI
jgi:hypothetical protein